MTASPTTAPGRVARVVVLGGGSAGWLVAGLLAAGRPGRVSVTVVEAPSIAPIGVGEGTWPTMRDTLRDIGVRETDFLRECDATFKQGSLFRGWVDGSDRDLVLHPFGLPHGHGDAPLAAAFCAKYARDARFAELVSVQAATCAHGRAPKQPGTPEYASVVNYGYHFDAGRLGPFLRAHCTSRLQVRHVADEVVEVLAAENGDIATLRTRQSGDLDGDLFIDCSGARGRLIAGHYGVPFVSRRAVLPCDAALALQLPYADPDAPIACQTTATAHAAGWVWDIGLQSRRGIGCVFSSAHADEDAARAVLRSYVGDAAFDALPAPRSLSFDPGHRAVAWHRNCVAIGQAAGFLEPLEASALALVEYAAGLLRDTLPATRAEMDAVARRFNDAMRHRWERIVEFLKLHYVLGRRDEPFWREHRDASTMPARLTELLAEWKYREPTRHDLERNDEAFPSASYQYILYGMGFTPDASFTDGSGAAIAALDAAERAFRECAGQVRRLLPALPTHRELIEHVRRRGLPVL